MVKICCESDVRAPEESAVRRSCTPGEHRWAIVLAGGWGARLQRMIVRWWGERRPKQYCTFLGKRSMLQHTIDRAASVVGGDHVRVVITRGHQRFFDDATRDGSPGGYLEQPIDCGTAAGVFLPLTYILTRDRDASVVILPADHFVYPEHVFNRYVRRVLELAEVSAGRIVMLGAVPDRPETDYGWILPGQRDVCDPDMRKILSFQEKPRRSVAQRLFRAGGLWNTMVVASKAETLWHACWAVFPDMMRRFQAIRTVLHAVRRLGADPTHEQLAIDSAYTSMANYDFAQVLLQRSDRSSVVTMADLDWSDWGRPERIDATLLRLGLDPLFSG